MRNITSHFLRGGVSLLATITLGGCATEEYVDKQVASLQSQITQLNGDTQTALKLASGKFNYRATPAMSVSFDTGSYQIPEADQAKLDELASHLKAQDKNVYLEIEGFADARGGRRYNTHLGLQRAYMVADYLRDKGVALNRMDVFTHGEDHPVGPNDTAAGQEMNRRVQISLAE